MIPYTDVGGPETDTSDGDMSITGMPSGSFFPDDAEEIEEEEQEESQSGEDSTPWDPTDNLNDSNDSNDSGETEGKPAIFDIGEPVYGEFTQTEVYILGGAVGLGAIYLLWRGSQ